MRVSYKACTEKGLSPDEAWQSVTGQIRGAHERGAADVRLHSTPTHSSVRTVEPKGPRYFGNEINESDKIDGAKRLQESLATLGYHGLTGCRLEEDGIPGPNTLHAIKSFQHAHHLHVDGIAGPRTLAALEEAKRYPLLSEATSPHHRMYQQVLHGIRALPRDQQPMGRQLENAAVALTIAAHGSGLHQIDHVVIGSNGVNLFAVQGPMHDPAHRRVHVELAHAVVHAPDHRSMTAAQPAPQHLHAQAVAQQQGAPRAPVTAGP
jgi:hypothetical protein